MVFFFFFYFFFFFSTWNSATACISFNWFPLAFNFYVVTMQAQRGAPPDMQCKDKFLIQSTVVPFGTTAEDLKPNLVSVWHSSWLGLFPMVAHLFWLDCSPKKMAFFAWQFSKENGRYIEENKLKVVLVSPPHSPVLLPINGSLKQEPANEPSNLKDQLSNGVENLPPSHVVVRETVLYYILMLAAQNIFTLL